MQPGDLVKVTSVKVERLLGGKNPGVGIIVSVSINMIKVQFLSEGQWEGKIKPLAKGWVEVISESR